MPFIRLREFSSTSSLLSVFIVNVCWILSSVFSVSVDMIICFLSFINMVYYIVSYVE